MYKVFKETLLTDMGRNKVRMHHRTTDAQAVWKEYSEYQMKVAYPRRMLMPLLDAARVFTQAKE